MSPWRFCVAPMLDWTDRHCRYFLRLLSRHARLYTEMVTTPALIHGDPARHLDFDASEHPVALQLGGSDPKTLAAAARLGERWGYDEINLNCGCPSERVTSGSFGACLMAEPPLVADCVRAMRDAVAVPVTVKHRIGLDAGEDYGFVRDFIGQVATAGCAVFIVHARNAVLKGLSPKENREIPPLRYDVVHRLKRDFPELTIVLNGGLSDWPAIEAQWPQVDGVMVGRAAYHDSWLLTGVDARVTGIPVPTPTRGAVLDALAAYAGRERGRGVPLSMITRHVLGLFHGLSGSRRVRQLLSDPKRLALGSAQIFDEARAILDAAAARPAPVTDPTQTSHT